MVLSGLMFVLSIPTIALSHGYDSLVVGRLLQGVSGGLIGVVVPLYLAECLTASDRGKGTGIFQWLLTLGMVIAASLGLYFSFRVDQVAKLGDAIQLFAFKDKAWRGIFWVSLPPGVLFVLGSMMVAESPRWLLRRGKQDPAYAALLRSRTTQQADVELREMQEILAAEKKMRPLERSRANRYCAESTSSPSCSLASFWPAIRQPGSIRLSATTRTFCCRAVYQISRRTGDT